MMGKLVWEDSFSVGVALLDEQHRRVIEMINSLAEARLEREVLSETLVKMLDYAREHFEAEEHLLAQHGYPDLALQRSEHLAFRKKTAAFSVETLEGR